MKQTICILLLSTATLVSRADEPAAKDHWSPTVGGLRTRLIFGESRVAYGDRLPEVYLELHNASNLGNPMVFDYNPAKSLHFELLTADGKPAPKKLAGGAFEDGFVFGPFQITLPDDGSIKFPITRSGCGLRPNFGTMLCFESAYFEIARGDQTPYFLSVTFDVSGARHDPTKVPPWHGALKLPPVKVPAFKP